MTYKFSAHSLAQRATLHPDLQMVCDYLIEFHDFRIQEGHRDEATQNQMHAEGKSKLRWPRSRHNSQPSEAMDLLPFVGGAFIGWDNWPQWRYFGGQVLATANMLHRFGEIGHTLRWGHDWNQNDNLTDQSFIDAPHFELIKP